MKPRPFAFGLVMALIMLLSLTGAAFADGPTTNSVAQEKGAVCVDGYVINHREMPVDGTKTVPPLVVEAASEAGPVQATVDANGYFKFEELSAGDWNFRLQLPEEWEGIVPAAAAGQIAETGVTTFAEKDGCYRIVFKVRRVIDVVVIKWQEGLDGAVTPGENWEITATPVGDPFVKAQTGKTTAAGSVGFTLTPGKWIISEKVKPGWTPITPSKLHLTLDQYIETGARPPIVFKNREPACYGSIVVQKLGYGTDPQGMVIPLGPLGGWKVILTRADGSLIPQTGVTDAEGKVTFSKLAPGVYKVKEVVQTGWKVRGDNPQTVISTGCGRSDVLFENEEIAGKLRIYGKKLFKAWVAPYKGELVGLAGWKITATLVGTDKSVSTMTNALGEYEFTQTMLGDIGFPGASVKVCEENRDNWIHVTPECVTVKFPYPVPDDYNGVGVNFTNVQDPPIAGLTNDAPVVSGSCAAYHPVAKGDTLAKIAVRYNVPMRSIIQANAIRNADIIYLGQKLCIP